MTATTITARVGTEDDSPSASVVYDFGDNLGEAVEKFGAEVVYSRFKSASVVDLQALVRRHLDSDTPKSETEIQALVNEWKPGVASRKRKSTGEKLSELFAQLNDADRQTMLEQLMSQA